MDEIKISVIIPIFNSEKYLEQCLQSVAKQTLKSIQIVCVDDGSTDKSFAICEKFAKTDSRFVCISTAHGGPSAARNAGLDIAQGEYLTFVDSDDFVDANAFEQMYRVATEQAADIAVFGASAFPRKDAAWLNNMLETRNAVYTEFDPNLLLDEVGATPFLWLHLVKRNLIFEKNLRFDEELSLGEDFLFELGYFFAAQKIVFCSKKFYHYRIHNSSLMSENFQHLPTRVHKHALLLGKVLDFVRCHADERFVARMFSWGISLVWGDLYFIPRTEQKICAEELKQIWQKFDVPKHKKYLSPSDAELLEEIFAMSQENYVPNKNLSALPSKPQKHSRVWKFFHSLKTDGLKKTLKKVFKKNK